MRDRKLSHVEKATSILRHYWGYESFRNGQLDVIISALRCKEFLAIMPTGAGKSICFQVPALMLEGVTVVISPLIALMQDQVSQLKKRGIKAEALYSGMPYRKIDRILDNCIYGEVKLLYVSPERTLTELFQVRYKKMHVPLLVIDEAHCISQWGYDFRPAYTELHHLKSGKPDIHLLALTATAPPVVQKDIIEALHIPKNHIYTFDLRRENLQFFTIRAEAKEQQLLSLLKRTKGAAVIYCRKRAATVEISDFLKKNGVSAIPYHAGMKSELREENQRAFMEGKVRVISATTAFGMGVDKSDVRYVYHLQLPSSPEEYFQEAGRAGRDNQLAHCVLIVNDEDIPELRNRVRRMFPSIEMIEGIFHALMSFLQIAIDDGEYQSFDIDIPSFAERFGYKISTIYNALFFIEKSGIIQLSEGMKRKSQVHVIMNRKDLYDLQVKYNNVDVFMRHLLRSYEGLFIDFVDIYESHIAKELGISIGEVIQLLEKMKNWGVIDYVPRSDAPQITLLIARPDKSRFQIDEKLYFFLKSRAVERMEAMIEFVESSVCRMRTMLAYFGQETDSCGKCDICLGYHIQVYSQEEEEEMRAVLSKVYKKNDRMGIQALVDCFPLIFRNKFLAYLSKLEREGHVRIVEGNKVELVR